MLLFFNIIMATTANGEFVYTRRLFLMWVQLTAAVIVHYVHVIGCDRM